MRIYLVQHGEAVSAEIDPDRPLTQRGRDDIERMAVFLAASVPRPGQICHSGKPRARQTAEIFAGKLSVSQTGKLEGISPNSPVEEFIPTLLSWQQDTMVVGHLPFMARLAACLLTGDAEKPVVEYRPGSVACLERLDESQWTLLWMLRPELLS